MAYTARIHRNAIELLHSAHFLPADCFVIPKPRASYREFILRHIWRASAHIVHLLQNKEGKVFFFGKENCTYHLITKQERFEELKRRENGKKISSKILYDCETGTFKMGYLSLVLSPRSFQSCKSIYCLNFK